MARHGYEEPRIRPYKPKIIVDRYTADWYFIYNAFIQWDFHVKEATFFADHGYDPDEPHFQIAIAGRRFEVKTIMKDGTSKTKAINMLFKADKRKHRGEITLDWETPDALRKG